jgi:hypothetical protein
VNYTNRSNLPKEIVRAITKDRYSDSNDKPSDYSASTLKAPVQMTTLKRRYPNKLIVPDVMDLFFQFKGSVGHQVLEDAWHEDMGSQIEERLYMEVAGKTLSGKFDCFQGEELRDYKFTKVYKYLKQDFEEYETQLNIYAALLRANGKKVSKLAVWMFLEDFKRHEAWKKGYPKEPIVSIDLRLWSDSEALNYISSRVGLLKNAESVPDEYLLECTPKEQWCDVKDWAVVKKDGTSKIAKKVFNFEKEALTYKLKSDEMLIKRMTKRTRCFEYCDVRGICTQHKRQTLEEEGKLGKKPEQGVIF